MLILFVHLPSDVQNSQYSFSIEFTFRLQLVRPGCRYRRTKVDRTQISTVHDCVILTLVDLEACIDSFGRPEGRGTIARLDSGKLHGSFRTAVTTSPRPSGSIGRRVVEVASGRPICESRVGISVVQMLFHYLYSRFENVAPLSGRPIMKERVASNQEGN